MKTFSDLIVLVFVVSSVSSVGLSLSWQQIAEPLRHIRPIVLSLLVNFVVVPTTAVVIARSMLLSEPQAVGLILVGSAAGAPFFPKLIEVAKGDVALSVGLMMVLMVGSLIYLPLTLPFLLPGVSVNSWGIARSLLITMILPLALGLVVKHSAPRCAHRLRSPLNALSGLSLVIALILVCVTELKGLRQLMASPAIPACVALLVLSFGGGYVFGGRTDRSRQVIGLGSAARNIPAALLIGGQNFADPQVVLMIVLSALISVALLVPATLYLARRSRHRVEAIPQV